MLYDDKKFIGNIIKNARKNAKYSQAQLSELIGMCDKNLGNIENGKQFPAVNNFLKIIEVLNLSLEDFGVRQVKEQNPVLNGLFETVLNSSEEKRNMYLDILKIIDKHTRI